MSDSEGRWDVVQDETGQELKTDVVPIHLAQMNTGSVLVFSGDEHDINNAVAGKSQLWDPITKKLTEVIPLRNLFCAGHCFLPDGRLMTAGGTANAHPRRDSADRDLHTFTPTLDNGEPGGVWTQHEAMDDKRWYPTCTTLPSGKALIVSGYRQFIPRRRVNTTSEVFDPATDELTRPLPFLHDVDLYPFVHVLPDRFLFVHYRDTTRLFDWNRREWLPQVFKTLPLGPREQTGRHTYPGTGACVMLPINADGTDPDDSDVVRILLVGGSTEQRPDPDSPATDVSQVFEFRRSDPSRSGWHSAGTMNNRRFMSDATLLPDGTVFVAGGASQGEANHSHGAVLQSELFDPKPNAWSTMAEAEVARLYHSTALLLPDGRVLAAGSTGHGWPATANEFRLEVFTPPCLADEGASGPSIVQGPRAITTGEPFTVVTPDGESVDRVALVRPSSVTHTMNMDQRYIELPVLARSVRHVQVAAPRHPWVAPPGWYMLFLVNGENCWSQGVLVQVALPEWASHPCFERSEEVAMLGMAHSAVELQLRETRWWRFAQRSRLRWTLCRLGRHLRRANRRLEECIEEHGSPDRPELGWTESPASVGRRGILCLIEGVLGPILEAACAGAVRLRRRCAEWEVQRRRRCAEERAERRRRCAETREERTRECAETREERTRNCAETREERRRNCCTWAPCSWACRSWVWVTNVVCVAWTWVTNVVCVAWTWITNVVCVAWTWVTNVVCVAWTWIVSRTCRAFTWVVEQLTCF